MKVIKNSFFKLSFVAACLAVVASCNKDKTDQNILIVSVDPQRAMLEEIVGDKYKVISVLTPGANPETFEPGMQMRRNLEDADAYFTVGYLPFEEVLERSAGKYTNIVNSSVGIAPIYGTHSHEHGHGHAHSHGEEGHHDHSGADPHVWTSVKNAKIIAANMLAAMKDIDPTNKDYYESRYSILASRLDSLDRAYTSRLSAPDINHAFAVWHPSLSYLARDYGLEQIAVGYENKEMPPSVLRNVIDEAREDSVKVLFFQKEFDSRQVENLNKELGTELITINPLDYEWEKQLDVIVSALCR